MTTNFFDIIKALAETSATNDKVALIATMDDTARQLMKFSLDPAITFGVKKFDAVGKGDSTSLHDFTQMLNALASRRVTGNAAIEYIESTLEKFSSEHAEILARVIRKDMAVHVGISTFNKGVTNYKVTPFAVQLASKIENADGLYRLSYPVFVDAKLDGARLLAFVHDDYVDYFSRTGKNYTHLAGVFDADLLKIKREHFPTDELVILDGEVMGDNFQETIQAKRATSHDLRDKLNFFVFDILVGTERSMTQRQRLDSLKQVFYGSEHANVFFNYPQVANNADEARLIYEACVQHGFEGVIVKAMDATYAPKRSKNWMKLKPVNTYDGTIKAFVEGEGEFVGMLGAMHIEGEGENGACFTAFVGSGLTQQQRAELWQDRESLIGRIVEVEAQEMTCVGDAHSLRFPVFIRFREDLK